MSKKIISLFAGMIVLAMAASAHALSVTGVTGVNVGVQATTSVQAQGVLNASGTVNVGVGTNASATTASGNLVQGSAVPLIQTDADLTAYNNIIMQSQPAVKAIAVNNDNTVMLNYVQPAKFLGIFSASLTGQLQIDAQGNTTVHLPWWSFLYTKNTIGIQATVAEAVQQSGVQFGAQTNAAAQLQNNAEVITAAAAAIQAQAQAQASASANVDSSGN